MIHTSIPSGSRLIESDGVTVTLEQLRPRCILQQSVPLSESNSLDLNAEETRLYWNVADVAIVVDEFETRYLLAPGDCFIVPAGRAIRVSLDNSPLDDGFGGDIAPARLVIGFVTCVTHHAATFRQLLNATVHISRRDLRQPALCQLLEFVWSEWLAKRDGGLALINQTLSLLLSHVILLSISRFDGLRPCWLAAFRDAEISQVLVAVTRSPERDWTVDAMAAVVPMGRSTFARRFRELLGETPMETLTGIRMRMAIANLEAEVPVKEVSRQAGYRSVSAFVAAFRRWSGSTPGSFLRQRVAAVKEIPKVRSNQRRSS